MGCYNNQAYFKSREGHGSFVPLCGLLKAEDFDNGSTGGSSPASIQVTFNCNYRLIIFCVEIISSKIGVTGCTFSEALTLASINPQC